MVVIMLLTSWTIHTYIGSKCVDVFLGVGPGGRGVGGWAGLQWEWWGGVAWVWVGHEDNDQIRMTHVCDQFPVFPSLALPQVSQMGLSKVVPTLGTTRRRRVCSRRGGFRCLVRGIRGNWWRRAKKPPWSDEWYG